jgi:hypothetical protein
MNCELKAERIVQRCCHVSVELDPAMSKSASVSSRPPAPRAESSLYDDRSAVRPRIRPRFASGDDLERKLRFARIVLQLLPDDDARARRLHAAMLERDPVLLESLLDTLGDSAG